MNKNRFVLPLIILILLLTLPLGIYGLINKLNGTSENPNKQHYYDGKIFYYNENGFLGKYICNSANCHDANVMVESDEVINHPLGSVTSIGLVNNIFAFIEDGNEIILYSLINGAKVLRLQGIKNYNELNSDGILLIKKDNKWGVFDINHNRTIVEPKYDYIGYVNQDNIKLYVVKENSKYYITDLKDKLSNEFETPIIDYNDTIIVVKDNDYYKLVDYNNQNIFNNVLRFDKYKDNVITLLNNNMIFIVNKEKERNLLYRGTQDIDYAVKDDKLLIFQNGNLEKEIPLGETNE